MRIRAGILVAASSFGLASCGEAVAEQTISGAAAGGATAVVLDGNPFTGAVVGSAGNLLYCRTNLANFY